MAVDPHHFSQRSNDESETTSMPIHLTSFRSKAMTFDSIDAVQGHRMRHRIGYDFDAVLVDDGTRYVLYRPRTNPVDNYPGHYIAKESK